MGLSLHLDVAADRKTFPIDSADLAALEQAAREPNLRDALGVIFGEGELGQARSIRKEELDRALRTVLDRAATPLQTVEYSLVVAPVSGMQPSTCSMLGGVRVGGALHMITTGPDTCVLQRVKAGADGKADIEWTRDIRDVRILQTDNLGEVRIVKRKRANALAQVLREIGRMVTKLPDGHQVRVTLG